jgi:hypothetical protein
MADGVTSAGSGPPANQTTNASQSQAQSQAKVDAQAALFGEALEQCPEGLHRPRPNDERCTYLRPPSLSSQSQSQSSKPDLQLHRDVHNPMRGPTDDLNIDYKKKMPHDRDQNPLSGAKPPDGAPSHDGGLSNDAHIIMVPLGPQAQKPSPDQTPYQPPR